MKSLKKGVLTLSLAGALALSAVPMNSTVVEAVGNGPGYGGNETINTSILKTYSEMADFLKKQDAKQANMELEVIGQSVKGRDLYVAKYISNPENPTILFLTQQHGNEQLTTEGALEFIKHLGTGKMKGVTDNVNILIVPMLNADGAMGDVDFSLDDYVASGDRNLTRYNAVGVDLNRDHVDKIQPETKALHDNVMSKYDIDYMIDLHHQGANSERDGKLVSGSILYPTTPNADPDVVEGSKSSGPSCLTPSTLQVGATSANTAAATLKRLAATASQLNTAFRHCCSRCAVCLTTNTSHMSLGRRAMAI